MKLGRDGSTDKPEPAESYCYRLATSADSTSQAFLGLGITLSILATGLALTGAIMGPPDKVDADSDDWWNKGRNALMIGSAGLLAIPSTYLLMRSADASTASAEAGQALSLEQADAMKKCLAARATWTSSRGEVATQASVDLKDRLGKFEELKEKTSTEKIEVEKKLKEIGGKGDSAEAAKLKVKLELLKRKEVLLDKASVDTLERALPGTTTPNPPAGPQTN